MGIPSRGVRPWFGTLVIFCSLWNLFLPPIHSQRVAATSWLIGGDPVSIFDAE